MYGLFGIRKSNYAEIIPFTDPYQHPKVVKDMVAVYRSVFTEHPWNEGLQCPKCRAMYHRRTRMEFCGSTDCKMLSVLLVEPWTVSRVTSDIYRETTTDGAKCFLAYRRKRLVGSAWGYPKTISEKLAQELDAPGLHEQLQGTYLYVDEVAVLPKHRRNGIATRMFAKIIEGEGAKVFLRTHKNSPMRTLGEKAGLKVIQSISLDRVMMAF